VRAAASALTDFAPGNHFYVQGHRLKIDQINVKLAEKETWYFCPDCNYIELRTQTASKACPRCGTAWSDGSVQHNMIRLTQVMATSKDRLTRISDDLDERRPKFYNKYMSVVIDPGMADPAWVLDSQKTSFAFQYIKQGTFREINMGEMMQGGAGFQFNGSELTAPGFDVCKSCGKILFPGQKPEKVMHDFECEYRRDPGKAQWLSGFFLYREMQSEAIRFLLPWTDALNSTNNSTFIAALRLGLREHFKGDIGHLRSCLDSVTLDRADHNGQELKRSCLVLYDSVPGGTGYLKELAESPGTMRDAFEKALKRMENCRCADDPTKDGCHRCILSTRMLRESSVSRTVAMGLLRDILADWDHLAKKEGIERVNINPLIESELEAQFIQKIGEMEGCSMEKVLIAGKSGWRLRVGQGDQARVWNIEAQHEVNDLDGETSTRPDFVFYPIKEPRAKGSEKSQAIAVYLDGKEWHADSDCNRISGDIKKRELLRLTQGAAKGMIVWTLTWNDLKGEKGEPVELGSIGFTGTMIPHGKIFCQLAQAPLKPLPEIGDMLMLLFGTRMGTATSNVPSQWEFLMRMLAEGTPSLMPVWKKAAGFMAFYANACAPKPHDYVGYARSAIEEGESHWSAEADQQTAGETPDCFVTALTASPCQMLCSLSQTEMMDKAFDQALCRLSFDADQVGMSEDFGAQWRAFWYLWNLFQVLPKFRATTPELAREGYRYEADVDAVEQQGTETSWLTGEEVVEALSGESADLLQWLMELPPLPEPSAVFEELSPELVDDNEINPTLTWEEQKVALFTDPVDKGEEIKFLEKLAWTVLVWPAEDKDQLRDELLKHLTH
jgi:hypothetical protein